MTEIFTIKRKAQCTIKAECRISANPEPAKCNRNEETGSQRGGKKGEKMLLRKVSVNFLHPGNNLF